jgi:hypothetical protein
MKIHFSVFIKNNGLIPESDLDLTRNELRCSFEEMSYISGALSIEHEDEQVIIRDELAPIIFHFCFNSLRHIEQKKNMNYRFSEFYGELELQYSDDYILIAGTSIKDIILPTRIFKDETLACGKRYIDFLEKLNINTLIGDLEDLKNEAAEISILLS